MGLLPAPAGVGLGDLAQPVAVELLVFGRWHRPWGTALRGAVLADDHTGPALGDPELLPEGNDRRRRRSGVRSSAPT